MAAQRVSYPPGQSRIESRQAGPRERGRAPALKHAERGDFFAAWGGIGSLQLGLSAVWTGARARGLGIERVVEWMCAAPARLAGLASRKGAIAPGLDADLVLFDPEAAWLVEPRALRHRHTVTPYLGRVPQGVVRRTWVRGRIAYDEGEVANEAIGRLIR